jgi:hypothetical protein
MVSSTVATSRGSSSSSIPPPIHVLPRLFSLLKTPYLAQPLLDKYNNNQQVVSTHSDCDNQKQKNSENAVLIDPCYVPISNKVRSNSHMRFLMEQYRMNRYEKAVPVQERLRQVAYDTYQLRSDIYECTVLQSLDTGAEEMLTPKEMSRRAAAWAGLYIPDYNNNNEDTKLDSNKTDTV